MTSFDDALHQVLALSGHPIRWHAPENWYESRDGGKTLSIRQTEQGDDPSYQMICASQQALRSGKIWLVQTLFCDPRIWWQFSTEYAEAPIVPLFFHKGRFIVGPAFSFNGAICPTCAGLRLAQGFPRPDLFESMLQSRIFASTELLGILSELLHLDALTGFVEKHLERLLNGELLSAKMSSAVLDLCWHRLLPPPGDHPMHYAREITVHLFGIPERGAWRVNLLRQTSGETLIDPLTGPLIATSLLPAEKQEPRKLVGAATITGSLGHFTRWYPDANGSGCNFDAERATLASIGEAVERYCGNVIPDTLLWSSERDLARGGRSFLSQRCFHYWSSLQTTSPLWPLAEVSEETSIPWVEGVSLVSPGKRVLLPAEVVYLKMTQVTGGKAHYPVNLAGIAAHRNVEEAREAALLELIERDATMVFWHGGRPVKHLVDLPPALSAHLSDGVGSSIRQWYLLLETEFPIAVTAACLHDQEQNILVVGFAARINLADALRKAAAEAWQLRRLSLLLQDPASVLWKEIDAGRLPLPTTPFRADRTYAKAFQPDFADMYQLSYSGQYYLDPSTHSYALDRLSGKPIPYGQVQSSLGPESVSVVTRCLPFLKEQHIYSVDVTTPDMRLCGFTVVRVLCPSLVGNAAAAFIPLAHPRLQQVATQQQKQISRIPMPHV